MADDSASALAAIGAQLFADKAYDQVLEPLGKLKQHKEHDPKVLHNMAITEYYSQGCREPRKLLDVLEKLKKQADDAKSKQEDGDGAVDVDFRMDSDPSLSVYNMAIICFQMKQYAQCASYLEDMFANIEPIDEFLAFKICFLLLDVYLLQRQVEQATEVISYVERSYQSLTKGTDKAGAESGADKEATPRADGEGTGTADWPNKKSTRPSPTTVTPAEVQLQLHIYQAKLQLLCRSIKSSKREIKSALNVSSQNQTALFLKSNLEYLRHNYRKSIKLLNSCQKTGGNPSLPVMYFNNMGCIHVCMKRYHAASFYFTRAWKENEEMYRNAQKDGVTLALFSSDNRSEMLYNMGLQLLFTKKPELAFLCFLDASQVLYSSARLWLRLGESCIAVHVLLERERFAGRGAATYTSTVREVLGSGEMRRLLLHLSEADPMEFPPANGHACRGEYLGLLQEMSHAQDKKQWAPLSVEFATQCFRNCLYLLQPDKMSPQPVTTSPAPSESTTANPSSPSSPGGAEVEASGSDLHIVRQLAMLNLTYCCLCKKDMVLALSTAQELIAIKECLPNYRYMGHLYAAEALANLNRADEAAQHLNPSILSLTDPLPSAAAAETGDMERTQQPYCTIPLPASFASKSARAALYSNLASVHLLQKDLYQAQVCVKQALAADPDCIQARMCLVYLLLRAGNCQQAVHLLKQQRLPDQSS